MPRPGPAARLTVHLPSTALWHHRPAYAEIVRRAHRAGLAGATVLHGVHGDGGGVLVCVVDDEPKVRALLAGLGDILAVTGHATLDRVEVYRPR
ncbi:DUF190 domain-containing protein [Streptomyces sp. SDT5-1]|uniref:DUF190 domain-containing protein n=1 Tax=Streptomyces sp. SDT5-1 TaxID=3406418 RepID=UPI003FD304C2